MSRPFAALQDDAIAFGEKVFALLDETRTAYQRGQGGFDNRILLRPRVGEYLVRLNGLLRPLIHRRWAAMVAALNHQEDSRLEHFLFGAQRLDLSLTRGPLWKIQDGRCFYLLMSTYSACKSVGVDLGVFCDE
jgi:hypothetical protein